jgi:hypothetical protein
MPEAGFLPQIKVRMSGFGGAPGEVPLDQISKPVGILVERMKRMLKTWGVSLANLEPFFRTQLKPAVIKSLTESFYSQTGPEGAWAGPSPAYAKKKNQMWEGRWQRAPKGWPVAFGSNVTGKQTGLLIQALTKEKRWGNIFRISGKSFFWGVDPNAIPYAAYAMARNKPSFLPGDPERFVYDLFLKYIEPIIKKEAEEFRHG